MRAGTTPLMLQVGAVLVSNYGNLGGVISSVIGIIKTCLCLKRHLIDLFDSGDRSRPPDRGGSDEYGSQCEMGWLGVE